MTFLLTGGSASGKSTFGEALATRLPAPRFLIDTARPDALDPSRPLWRTRLEAAGFQSAPCERAPGDLLLPARGTALVECLCHLCANEMFDERGRGSDPFDAIVTGMDRLAAQCGDLIVVTNEVGCEPAAYGAGTLRYIEALGRLNAALAARFDHVYELVAGIPLVRKGTLI